jgi:hypothetical protein
VGRPASGKKGLPSALQGKLEVRADVLFGLVAALTSGDKMGRQLAQLAKKEADNAVNGSESADAVDVLEIGEATEISLPFNPLSA